MRARVAKTLARAPVRRSVTARARRTRARASNRIDVLVFDLDGVLYDGANGYLERVRSRQRTFLMERYGMSEEEARETRERAFGRASQAWKGLRDLGFDVGTQDEFTAYCRSGVEEFLSYDEVLESVIRKMPHRKCVFTNTSETQGLNALRCLKLDPEQSDVFEQVFGGVFTAPVCKPQKEAFEKVLAHLGDVDPRRCVMFEDSVKNLKTAKELGMKTVFIKTRGEEPSVEDLAQFDVAIDSLHDVDTLMEKMPELFEL